MNNEEFIKRYEELLDKDYCNCNEMNCIDNNSPRRILNIVKTLQQENQKLKEEIEQLKKRNHVLSISEEQWLDEAIRGYENEA